MKKKFLMVFFGLLLTVGIAGTFWGPNIVEAASFWDSCRKNVGYCYFPGDCRSYIDTNGDGICDRSQPEPVEEIVESPQAAEEPVDTGIETVSVTVNTGETRPETDASESAGPVDAETARAPVEAAPVESGSIYYFLQVFLPVVILYGITWLASRRRMIPLSLHRKIWNYILLVPALASCIFGIILTAQIEFGMTVTLPFDMLFWHVEAGIVMGTVAVLHIAWHWKYFMKALKFAREDR
ncbi:MAG: hypothetical protein JW712_08435 [Dehalococcoidales bacterium]|nr:hypothetical protein [Dehalococcoidales bacterium]